MLYRTIFYLVGLFLTSLGLSFILIYFSFYNVGFSLIEIFKIILSKPGFYIFLIGAITSLTALLYDIIKAKTNL